MTDTAHLAAGPAGHDAVGVEPAGPAQRLDGDALACGTPVGLLVDQVDAGRLEPADAHQSGCPHCRQSLLQAATAGQALALLRATHGPVPADLVGRVMRAVRRTRQPGPLIELAPSGAGRERGIDVTVAGGGGAAAGSATAAGVAGVVRVHQQVLADIARVAADGLGGARVARSSASGQPGRPGAVAVSLGLLVDGRTPLPELAGTVRRAVRAALRAGTGSSEMQIELTALDLLEPPDASFGS